MSASVIQTYLLLKQSDGHVALSLAVWNGDGSYEDRHPLIAETTHGFNATSTALEVLGLQAVPSAPILRYKNLELTKFYGPDGMTPTTIEGFLEAFPAVTASEGFWNSYRAERERRARLARSSSPSIPAVIGSKSLNPGEPKASRPNRDARRQAKREAKLEAKLEARARRVVPSDLPSDRQPKRASLVVPSDPQGNHTYESHDLLAAASARASQPGRFVNGIGTVCKYVDPVTKAKKVHDGSKDISGAVIRDVARVWLTLDLEGTTWYVKVLEPGALISFSAALEASQA